MIKVLIPLALLALAGCASDQVGVVTSVNMQLASTFAKVGAFTIADLQAADLDAKAHGDTVASMCYEAVIPMIQQVNAIPLTAPIGAVSAFQDLRDGINTTNGAQGLLKQLEIPCGPLAADVNITIVQLVSKFAGAVAPNPISAILP